MTNLGSVASPTGPLLTVYDPDGTERATIVLASERVSVGRLPDVNDIALEPDPDQLVTRKQHCVLSRVGARWYVHDEGSANGTFVRRSGELVRVGSETELDDGDVVCIVGRWERRRARYWELAFTDRTRTRAIDLPSLGPQLVYKLSSRRLVFRDNDGRHELDVRPQVHKLVVYMASRNAEAAGETVLCSHDELMEAVWGDEPFHTRNDLTRLFWELRQQLETHDAGDLLEAERGRGYRLAIAPA